MLREEFSHPTMTAILTAVSHLSTKFHNKVFKKNIRLFSKKVFEKKVKKVFKKAYHFFFILHIEYSAKETGKKLN